MSPTQAFVLALALPVLAASCVLLGAWIQYQATRGKSPMPTLPAPRRPAPAQDDDAPEELHKL